MEDKRIDEINKMKELEDKLKLLEEDLELTEKAIEDANIDYCRRRELNDDILYDRREILNVKKQIKVLKFGKSLR